MIVLCASPKSALPLQDSHDRSVLESRSRPVITLSATLSPGSTSLCPNDVAVGGARACFSTRRGIARFRCCPWNQRVEPAALPQRTSSLPLGREFPRVPQDSKIPQDDSSKRAKRKRLGINGFEFLIEMIPLGCRGGQQDPPPASSSRAWTVRACPAALSWWQAGRAGQAAAEFAETVHQRGVRPQLTSFLWVLRSLGRRSTARGVQMTTIEDHPGRHQQNWKSLTNWELHTYSNSNSKAERRRTPRWSEPRNFRNAEPR